MLLDLSLRLYDETEVDAIAGDAGGRAEGEGAGIPEGIEQRRAGIELGEPLLRPRQ